MRTYIATLCAAAVFATAATTVPTCADFEKAAKKACADAEAKKSDAAVLKKCNEAVPELVKTAKAAKPAACSGASTLLAGAAAIATMAALF